MKFNRRFYAWLLLVFISMSFSCVPEQVTLQQITTAYTDPARFEKDIQVFETEDKTSPPPPGAIVCTGSSSMRMWSTIHEDLAPLTLIHRGFGGSSMNDALYFSDRIVISYHPRVILHYEGDEK